MIDIFFDIVFAAVIFSRMGDGKNSGNLIFKKIFSGSNFNIIDGETGITFSTTGGSGVAVDKIAWGKGTGITSSTFYVYNSTNRETISGLSSIRNDHNLLKGSFVDSASSNSFIVGGESNYIKYFNSAYSIILGGKTHSVNTSRAGVILSGCNNSIYNSSNSTIIGGIDNSICNGGGLKDTSLSVNFSSIISSSASCITSGNIFSSIISSRSSKICGIQLYCCNKYNTIISSDDSIIGNESTDSAKNGQAYSEYTCLSGSTILASVGSCIILGASRSGSGGVVYSKTCDCLGQNVIMSSKESCINNRYSFPCTNFNIALSSEKSIISSNFSNISGRCNRIRSIDSGSKPGDPGATPTGVIGKYSQILGGCGNFLQTRFSSIISSINSTMSVGTVLSCPVGFNQIVGGSNHYIPHVNGNTGYLPFCGMYHASIIGGSGNKITSLGGDRYPNSHFATILGGYSNCANGYSIIVGGKFNKTGVFDHNAIDGKIQVFGVTTSSYLDRYHSGMIFGGYKNSAFRYSILLGGSCNESIKCGSIIGGCKNCSGFQYNQSYVYNEKTFSGTDPYTFEPLYTYSADRNNLLSFRGTTSSHRSYILGGSENCTTSDFGSVIIGGCKNVTRNVNRSVIIGGSCNHIKAHGDFSGISGLVVGGTNSEQSALFALYIKQKPNIIGETSPLLVDYENWVTTNSTQIWPSPYETYPWQTQVNDNFIIGGKCNRFKSCFPNNYTIGSYGYGGFCYYSIPTAPYFSLIPAGLSNSSTSFVANSGIVGGYRNCILNTYSLMGGIGDTYIPGSSGKYGGRIINSVILGGQNLILSRSNMVCASESILVDTVSINNPFAGGNCQGTSGHFCNPTIICVVGGLITCVI